MENVFDQQNGSNQELVAQIISDITSEEVLDIVTEEDFTKADESEIVWETL